MILRLPWCRSRESLDFLLSPNTSSVQVFVTAVFHPPPPKISSEIHSILQLNNIYQRLPQQR
jgi:hypothetical protein